ncbi:unnamed protein product [Rotaria socialis]|uniref:O-phosphoseryl-tRNA(Sec) selenium transferase n=2 Tax=Rotaria socialis TaxID=392032 RepID=A0A818BIJ4_9BILA|nr:unnamed protein product [Rotaria socialis]CAF3187385.1 unnamed protein product [Rotaria socialis]CAF3301571.1 unnamed protein product [Rotaria socialis]CAF3416414.1 unnamed protein product [Rotaria socialis]CAF4170890.1 unnamed protein product [Rotaria socialis]
MNDDALRYAERLVPRSYIDLARQARRSHEQQIRQIIEHRKLPEQPLEEHVIEQWINEMAQMDSNNFEGNVGVGEREGRIYSSLVARRHSLLSHGIGRSGDINAIQPKAAGSSLLNKLTNELVLDAIHALGLRTITHAVVIPMATGMTMTLCLLTFKKQRPQSRYVLWSRIDQKSCFKSILTANLEPIIIEQIENNNYLQTNVDEFEKQIHKFNPHEICCIISTTSCFAPRAIDNVQQISNLCQKYSIPHLINNAYGLQSTKIIHEIEQAKRSNGRIDYIVQSTDKNFLVPVGGSIVLTYDSKLFDALSHAYPGRASITPTTDMFITLLSMGKKGLLDLVQKRKNLFNLFYEKLIQWTKDNDEYILSSKQFSPISIAISLKHLPNERVTELGSMLFTRRISGARVIKLGTKQTIDTYEFMNYGAHSSNIQCSYLTVAASIGMEESDIDIFMKKFDSIYQKLRRNENSDD